MGPLWQRVRSERRPVDAVVVSVQCVWELGTERDGGGAAGSGGGDALDLSDNAFLVPSNNTGRIQEAHITAGHAIMEHIEDKLIDEGYLSLQ